MGAWTLADLGLEGARVSRSAHYTVQMATPVVAAPGADRVEIAWGNRVTLTGNFLFTVTLSRADILRLFKLVAGEVLDHETISESGLSIDEGVVLERLRAMSVGELFELLSSRHSAAEPLGEASVGEVEADFTGQLEEDVPV